MRGDLNKNNINLIQILKINRRRNYFTRITLFGLAIASGDADDGATPLPVARQWLPRRHGGPSNASASPLAVAKQTCVRRHARWRGTIGLGKRPLARPRPRSPSLLTPHLSLPHPWWRRLALFSLLPFSKSPTTRSFPLLKIFTKVHSLQSPCSSPSSPSLIP
jgi:hypothetical protein